ncbi:MAG: hypothetical protein EBZ89_12390 [Chloroflexi bacterium]|nr:hypothetical protein [Chloroflexota bacterium]
MAQYGRAARRSGNPGHGEEAVGVDRDGHLRDDALGPELGADPRGDPCVDWAAGLWGFKVTSLSPF